MTQMQSAPTMPFPMIIEQALGDALSQHILNLAPKGALDAYAFRILETPLVYLLNEHRLQDRFSGTTPEVQYEEFSDNVTGILFELRERFPDHWRRWLEAGTSLRATFETVLRRVTEDATPLSQLLKAHHLDARPRVISIKPLGDIHPQGVVCEVVTSSGTVYYKPRPAGNELFVSALADWMAKHTEPGLWLGLKFPEVADCGDHTWVAPVHHQPLADTSEASRYYHRAGHLLGLSYLVNITDLHHENIIATATQPVPVDLETIMSVFPRSVPDQNEAGAATLRQTTQSPAATGLIPLGSCLQELGGDVSGLAADGLRVKRRVLDRQGRSDMRYVHVVSEVTPGNNRPILEGTPVPPAKYVDDIVEGFATVLRTAINHRESLLALLHQHANSIHVRVIARMTNDYAVVLAGLSRVSGNNNPERIMAMLRENAAGLADTMVASEEAQLRRWAVPHFWAAASERIIRDPWGQPTGKLDEAPLENTLAKINSFTSESIDHQVSLIRTAFRSPEQIVLPLGGGLAKPGAGSFEEFENTHFSALRAQAVTGIDGSVNWPVLAIDERDQLTVQPLIGGVYRGLAGVAELLVTTRKTNPRWQLLAQHLLNTLRHESHSLLEDASAVQSYYQGPASQLAAAERLRDAFELSAPWISQGYGHLLDTLGMAAHDCRLDVMEGAAGMIIALRHHQDSRTRALCRELGHRLRLAAHKGWDSKDVCPLSRNASFAHDSGGMGTGVLIAAAMTEEVELVESWRGAWEFENTFKLAEGWRDARSPGENISTHWCHGLAGIALARIMWLKTIRDNPFLSTVISPDEIVRIRQELDEAARLLARDLAKSGSPSLCHGISGGALVLDLAGKQLGNPQWRAHAEDLVIRAGATLSRCPWLWGDHDVRDFGIMTGPGGLLLAQRMLRSPHGGVGPLLPDLGRIGAAS